MLHGRAVEAPSHYRIDAKDLPAVVLDDLIRALPTSETRGKLFCGYTRARFQHGISNQAQHLPVRRPE